MSDLTNKIISIINRKLHLYYDLVQHKVDIEGLVEDVAYTCGRPEWLNDRSHAVWTLAEELAKDFEDYYDEN